MGAAAVRTMATIALIAPSAPTAGLKFAFALIFAVIAASAVRTAARHAMRSSPHELQAVSFATRTFGMASVVSRQSAPVLMTDRSTPSPANCSIASEIASSSSSSNSSIFSRTASLNVAWLMTRAEPLRSIAACSRCASSCARACAVVRISCASAAASGASCAIASAIF